MLNQTIYIKIICNSMKETLNYKFHPMERTLTPLSSPSQAPAAQYYSQG